MNPFKLADELIKSDYRISYKDDPSEPAGQGWEYSTIDKVSKTIALSEILSAIREEYRTTVEMLNFYKKRVGTVYIVQTIHLTEQNSSTEIHGYFATSETAKEFLSEIRHIHENAQIFTKKVNFK
jgi:hypothetical protein